MFKRSMFIIASFLLICGCQQSDQEIKTEAQSFVDSYSQEFQELYYTSAKAEWQANTRIVEGDTATANEVQEANESLAAFTGSEENIEKATKYLEKKDKLTEVQVKQFDAILYAAANNPQTADSLVSQRIRLENELNNKLFGFDFKIQGQSVSTNEIDGILRESANLEERLQALESSKEVGKVLKQGLAGVRNYETKQCRRSITITILRIRYRNMA